MSGKAADTDTGSHIPNAIAELSTGGGIASISAAEAGGEALVHERTNRPQKLDEKEAFTEACKETKTNEDSGIHTIEKRPVTSACTPSNVQTDKEKEMRRILHLITMTILAALACVTLTAFLSAYLGLEWRLVCARARL